MQGRQDRQGLGGHASVLKSRQVAAIEVIPPADDHLGSASFQSVGSQAGVGERGHGGIEHQELIGLAAFNGPGHDAVLGRVESDRRVEIPATPAGDAIVGHGGRG